MGAKNDSKKGRGKGVVLSFSFELELSHFPDFFPRLLSFQEMGGDKKIKEGGAPLTILATSSTHLLGRSRKLYG